VQPRDDAAPGGVFRGKLNPPPLSIEQPRVDFAGPETAVLSAQDPSVLLEGIGSMQDL